MNYCKNILLFQIPRIEILEQILDINFIEFIVPELQAAKTELQKFNNECKNKGIVFQNERNLIFAYILHQTCPYDIFVSMYGANRWACITFDFTRETFRKLFSTGRPVSKHILLNVIRNSNASLGMSCYYLLSYGYSICSIETIDFLMSLNSEFECNERRVA